MNETAVLVTASVLVSFILTAVLGKWLIPFLRRLKFGQTIREVGPDWHKKKQGTPTMGGIMFILGTAAVTVSSLLLFPAAGIEETPLLTTKTIAGLGMAVAYGIIGFLDDYISVVKKRNLGLNEKQKLVLQFLVAGGYLACVWLAGGNTQTTIPFLGKVELGIFYYILSALVIVGIVNAVNFTDGIDGLNSIVCIFAFIGLSVCSLLLGIYGNYVLGCIAAAALVGFLVWNFHPAKVFMGDTGSLFLGGILCALAFGIDMPVLLLPAGIVSIIEILSVVLQVTYFKATGGKRLFKMSPIHHHFEMKGWSELKICGVFGFISLLGAAVSISLVIFGV